MNARQLEYVIAAVETGGFTAAADRCGVAQPSLSGSIARLERELAVPLFHRVGRRVVPTDACTAMLPSARDAVNAVDRARRAVESVQVGLTGRLDVAVQPSAVMTVVPLVAALVGAQPGVACSLHAPRDGDSITSTVASGRCEVGIGDVQERVGLVWRVMRSEPYVLIESSTSGTRSRRRDVDTLGDLPLVLPPEGSPTRSVIDALFVDAGIEPRVVVEVDHREALLPLVIAGAGATILPESMASGSAGSTLHITRLTPQVERRVGIVARDAPLTPAASRFVELASSM